MTTLRNAVPPTKQRSTRSIRRTWSLHAERASLRMQGVVLEEAIRNYQALANLPHQMQLAREIAQARGAELTLAYRNVVMVSAGLRRCTVDGGEKLTREPCVVFVVRRKWKKDASKDAEQFLPSRLLTHTTGAQGRMLVAVPTDVQIESRYAAARSQSDRAICVRSPEHAAEYGALTALIEVSEGHQSVTRALSPLHVLTPTFSPVQGSPVGGAMIEIANGIPQHEGSPRIGTSLPIGGQLVPGPEISFDAQLIDVTDMRSVSHMLEGVPLSAHEPFIASPERYDELTLGGSSPVLQILLPDNHPQVPTPRPSLFAEPAGTSNHAYPIPYQDAVGDIVMIQHWMVIHLQCPAGHEPINGDSGSPVVLWFEDGSCTFVGMHIAGCDRLSHVLPAWALMFAGSYLGTLPDDSKLSLIA